MLSNERKLNSHDISTLYYLKRKLGSSTASSATLQACASRHSTCACVFTVGFCFLAGTIFIPVVPDAAQPRLPATLRFRNRFGKNIIRGIRIGGVWDLCRGKSWNIPDDDFRTHRLFQR